MPWSYGASTTVSILAFRKFLQRSGIRNPDVIKLAGGAKNLASPSPESNRDFVIDQISTSIRLHKTSRAILMVHSDCGGYGGLRAFGGDVDTEGSATRLNCARQQRA